MVVTNTGSAKATKLVLTDTLPIGFAFVDSGKDTKTWNFASLAAGAHVTVTAKVKIGAGVLAGKYTNRAYVTAAGLDPVNALADVKVTVPQVLGLATTGANGRDYMIFAFGLLARPPGLSPPAACGKTRLRPNRCLSNATTPALQCGGSC